MYALEPLSDKDHTFVTSSDGLITWIKIRHAPASPLRPQCQASRPSRHSSPPWHFALGLAGPLRRQAAQHSTQDLLPGAGRRRGRAPAHPRPAPLVRQPRRQCRGETLYEVQDLLGQSSAQMTQRYTHLADAGRKRVVDKIGAVVTAAVRQAAGDEEDKAA